MFGILDRINDKINEGEKKKAAKDREKLNQIINDIQPITFKELMDVVEPDRVQFYREQIATIIKLLEDANPTDMDIWDVDHNIQVIVGELKDAIKRRTIDGINVCLRALKYAALTRKMDIPNRMDEKEYLKSRNDIIERHLFIIRQQKVIDEESREVFEKEDLVRLRQEERLQALESAEQYANEHPQAALEVKKHFAESSSEYKFDTVAIELRTRMRNAVNKENAIKELQAQIAALNEEISAAAHLLEEAEADLSRTNAGITKESLEESKRSREMIFQRIDRINQMVDEIFRASNEMTDYLEASQNTERQKRRFAEVSEKFDAMLEKERIQHLADEEARGELLREKREQIERENERLRELQEQREIDEELLEKAEAEKQKIYYEEEEEEEEVLPI